MSSSLPEPPISDLRFVILEHTTASRRERANPAALETVHWDLILYDRLSAPGRTWRLDHNPLDPTDSHAPRAKPIADHRSIYWQYEGELTRDRGTVRRIARGVVPGSAASANPADLLRSIRNILAPKG